MIAVTPLDAWIREKTAVGPAPKGRPFLDALKAYQIEKINETIAYARQNTLFYSRHLAFLPDSPLKALPDLAKLPFTTPADLAENPMRFLAVRQDDISKIVTLRTSGSTGDAKRIFFTEADLELTIDFFHRGMSTLVHPGRRAMILLPGEKPDSVGDLLLRGLKRLQVEARVYGPVADPAHAARAVDDFGAHCLIGIPTQVLAVALSQAGTAIGKGRIESLLLSTDNVPKALSETLTRIWGCRVFTHYGMTEMGFGGGVECGALDGYHLREADLYFEVVDPDSGVSCEAGRPGEVVFTTLTRLGMPLIRYRTGDIGRFIAEPCLCGTALRRLGHVRGRRDGAFRLSPDAVLTLPDLDEALFRLPGLLDYRAAVSKVGKGKFRLHVEVCRTEEGRPSVRDVLDAACRVAAVRRAMADGCMDLPTAAFSESGRWATTGAAKRKIIYEEPGVRSQEPI